MITHPARKAKPYAGIILPHLLGIACLHLASGCPTIFRIEAFSLALSGSDVINDRQPSDKPHPVGAPQTRVFHSTP